MGERDRTPGFFNKALETMDRPKKEAYLEQRLRETVVYAYRHAPAFRQKLESIDLKPEAIKTIVDLEKIPVTDKAQLMELQKKAPPFGGLAAVPAEKAEKMGLDLRRDLTLRVGFVAAEMLPESLRDSLEARFGMLVRQSYGTADVGSLGYECVHKMGMHFPDDKIVEIVDPVSRRQLGPGEIGEIIATTFNKTYPLIRYATGDLSYLTEEPCPCGRTSPRLVKILGRVDQVPKVRGMFIHPSQVDQVVSRHPEISRCQILVTRKEHRDEMTFRTELRGSGIDQESLTDSLKQTIRDVMKLRAEIEIVAPGTIPDEAKRIEDQRKWD